jgi:hypothetical protein
MMAVISAGSAKSVNEMLCSLVVRYDCSSIMM